MKILVTGFEPFLGAQTNPSEILATLLAAEFPQIDSLILPVEFANSFGLLKARLQQQNYDFLIMIGQAAGRRQVCFEKIGLNWVQTEYPDEKKVLPPTGVISDGRPLALMSLFPVDEVFRKLKVDKWPVEISFSAGTFVCNELYFRVLAEFGFIRSVFIHVPLVQELEIEVQLATLRRVIEIISELQSAQ